tara:strand:- start:1433 stop:2131 length:699 start_codon:yes stop_codon:yes gene_type:complete
MKETSINDLDTRLSEEESNIVDSIINDLNSNDDKPVGMPPNLPPSLAPGNGMPPGMPPGMAPGMPPRMDKSVPQPGVAPNIPQPGMPPNIPQNKIIVTPEQKKLLDSLPIEEQQNVLRKIKLKQEQDKALLEKSLNSTDEEEEDNDDEKLTEEKIKEIKGSVIDDLKNSIKEPILISLVAFILSLPQINKLFLLSKTNILVNDNGELTLFTLMLKGLLVGIIYFCVKKYKIM